VAILIEIEVAALLLHGGGWSSSQQCAITGSCRSGNIVSATQ
jgi:hypothetical protein